MGDDAACADNGVLADHHIGQNGRARADRGAGLDTRRLHFPVALGLEIAGFGGRARIGIVDERDAVADKHVILDRHAFADEGVARDLAAPSDRRVLLNFDERTDFCFIADFAAV